VNTGAAQVGIDQEDADSLLREHDRGVDAGGSFSLLRTRTGYHDDFWRRSQVGEQERSAQRAIRFGHLRLWANLRHGFYRFLG